MPGLSMQAPVSQTLLIPLAARAQENQRKHPVISDPKAAEIFVRLDVSNTAVYGGPISTHGILARTKVIDDEIKALLARKPTMSLINLVI